MFNRRFYVFVVSILSLSLVYSCFHKQERADSNLKLELDSRIKIKNEKYGSYLAGRVAHLRRDFDSASSYYKDAAKEDPNNIDILSNLYVILSSEGDVPGAARYADEAIKKGDENNFTHIVIFVDKVKSKKYEEALSTLNNLKGGVYTEFINPLLRSWVYAGQGKKEEAFKEIAKIKKEEGFIALYNFHAGMIADYFDDSAKASENYGYLINEGKQEMSFRALQLISNYLIRNGEKEKAVELVARYNDDRAMVDMLNRLYQNVVNADVNETPKILTSPDYGVSEALFSIAVTLRQGVSGGADLAHMFICLSIYENEEYDLAKLVLADILEARGMLDEANNLYDKIGIEKESYYTAQMKKATNYTISKRYDMAVDVLNVLIKDNPNDYQILFDLGDNLRMLKKYPESIEFYNKVIGNIESVKPAHWVVFYALGVSYERMNNWEKAEENFRRAIELSNKNYVPLNYLGYYLIDREKNIEEAFDMIADAYKQAPNDGHIVDSVGWALYKIGMFDDAVKYLEKASEVEPGNALVRDHLGDAYWASGRKIEATYQWKYALILKEDIEEVDVAKVKIKIDNGADVLQIPEFNKDRIKAKLNELTNKDN